MSDPAHPLLQFSSPARVTLLGPLNGGPSPWHVRFVKVLLALCALFMVLDFNYPFDIPNGSEFDKGQNGMWVEKRWSDTFLLSDERMQLASLAVRHGIKWVYADEGTLLPDGRLPRTNFMYAGGLVSDMHLAQPGLRVLARVSGRSSLGGGDLRLSDTAVRQRIAEACAYFVDQQGFDGVHLDIEAAPSGDPNYLKLLDEIRPYIGKKTLSIASMQWTPLAPRIDNFSVLPSSWDDGYYKEVGRRADQIVLMKLDSAIPFANLYIKYAKWQTEQLLETMTDVPSCQLLLGVPTYSDTSWNFHPRAENIGSGLQGVIEGLKEVREIGNLPPNFAGVALFASRTTSPEEWALYDTVWREAPGQAGR